MYVYIVLCTVCLVYTYMPMLSVYILGHHSVTGCYILLAVVMVPSWLLPTGAKQPVPLN